MLADICEYIDIENVCVRVYSFRCFVFFCLGPIFRFLQQNFTRDIATVDLVLNHPAWRHEEARDSRGEVKHGHVFQRAHAQADLTKGK